MAKKVLVNGNVTYNQRSFGQRVKKDWQRNKWKYILLIPVVIYFIIFCYKPMYGILIAFQNYRPRLGISGSEWIGL